jgi:hypothetical protein
VLVVDEAVEVVVVDVVIVEEVSVIVVSEVTVEIVVDDKDVLEVVLVKDAGHFLADSKFPRSVFSANDTLLHSCVLAVRRTLRKLVPGLFPPNLKLEH